MPKKKKFIDKKNSVTFHLVHRSQHDPLTVDENAPQLVLLPAVSDKTAKNKRKEEQAKFGIYFDDDYNYLQHLRNVNKVENEWIEVPKTSKAEKQTLNLPSSVFASTVEEEVGLLNKAAPESGLRLDLDPDVVAAMDEDFNYNDPDNVLEDNFMELANKSPSGSEYGDNEDNSDKGKSSYSSEFGDEVDSLWNLETKSRFTDYSMTSSVITRNSQLTLLDETFEQMYMNYEDVEIGALDCDEIEGEIDVDSPMFKMAADQFEKERQRDKLTIGDISKLRIDSSDESDVENDYLVEVKEKERWDCESILSTYSNIYNHPKLIQEPTNKIKINKRTGIPMEIQRLTKHSLAQLENSTNKFGTFSHRSASLDSSVEDENELSQGKNRKSLTEKKIGKESLEEKKARKKQLKECRKERRMERKANITAFKEEKKKLEKNVVQNNLNRQGIVL